LLIAYSNLQCGTTPREPSLGVQ
jgi:hypothetical protein